MIATASGIIALLFYSIGAFFQSQNLTSERHNRKKVLFCGLISVLAHLLYLSQIIPTPAGYDFGFFKITTLFSWSISVIVLLSSLKKPVDNLFLALFPLAIISIICSLILPSNYTPHSDISVGVALHILLGILSFSIMTIAAFQALLVSYLSKQLKQKQSFSLVQHLPPLQTMEALLFELVWGGLIALTGVIVTGILFMEDFFAQSLSHKTAFSVISWIVFAILVWGRHQLGWRGKTALRWILTGFAFLILAYFGSKFVLELILNRS